MGRARKEHLQSLTVDPYAEIVHPGSGAAHAFRATRAVLDAWRDGSICTCARRCRSGRRGDRRPADYLDATADASVDLPGSTTMRARLLASEILVLLLAPLSDLDGATKRNAIRGPLMLMADPPPLPIELSADLEHGFVPGGKAFAADPVDLLR